MYHSKKGIFVWLKLKDVNLPRHAKSAFDIYKVSSFL